MDAKKVASEILNKVGQKENVVSSTLRGIISGSKFIH